jgi:hypothetical protein
MAISAAAAGIVRRWRAARTIDVASARHPPDGRAGGRAASGTGVGPGVSGDPDRAERL